MDLREQQDLLARIFTQSAGAETEGLIGSASDTGTLSALAEPGDIKRFSDSLFWKRLREVEKLLPLTRQALDEDFQEEFRRFHGTFQPKSLRRHLEDAIAFCDHIRTRISISESAVSAAAFEAAKLTFFGYEQTFAFCRRVPETVTGKARRSLSFAIWIRIGGRVRYFIR